MLKDDEREVSFHSAFAIYCNCKGFFDSNKTKVVLWRNLTFLLIKVPSYHKDNLLSAIRSSMLPQTFQFSEISYYLTTNQIYISNCRFTNCIPRIYLLFFRITAFFSIQRNTYSCKILPPQRARTAQPSRQENN